MTFCAAQEHLKAISQRQGGDVQGLGDRQEAVRFFMWRIASRHFQPFKVQAAFRELSAVAELSASWNHGMGFVGRLGTTQVLAHISGNLAGRTTFARSDRLGSGLGKRRQLQRALADAWEPNQTRGYLTSNPANIGTALRASNPAEEDMQQSMLSPSPLRATCGLVEIEFR